MFSRFLNQLQASSLNSLYKSWWLFVLLFVSSISHLWAIDNFQNIDYIQVWEDGRTLQHAWSGGLNSAQFSDVDLNGDGLKDLIVYEKTEDRVLTFIAVEPGKYELDRAYIPHIPKINGWLVARDINCDGEDDLFTYNHGSMMIYTGYRDEDTLKFELYADEIFYQTENFPVNLYSTFIDRPAIVDVDFDGDLDILTFDVTDSRILWYKNQRVEKGLPCDTLAFILKDNCWGNVFETEMEPMMILGDTCSHKFNPGRANTELDLSHAKMRHAGSTLEAIDIQNRGMMDILIGDVTFNFINLLRNYGSRTQASIVSQDTLFPAYDTPVNVGSFPLAVAIDVDHDGKKDLLVTPFEGMGVDNIDNVWWYKNVGKDTMKLNLQTKSFLVGDMIDVGENAVPTLIDIDGDGLKDLLISGFYRKHEKIENRIHYYKNIGTPETPAYRLENDDFLNFKSLNLTGQNGFPIDMGDPFVHAGDLDHDGRIDILVGVKGGQVLFFKNISTDNSFRAAAPQILKYQNQEIDVGLNAAPFVVDLDGDGKSELAIGSFNGHVYLYSNTAIAGNVQLQFLTDSLGKVSSNSEFIPFGYSAVSIADIDGDGKKDLILGGFNNYLKYVSNIEDSVYHQVTPQSFHSLPKMLGKRLVPYYAHATNQQDGTLLIGSLSGGLSWYSQNPPENVPVSVKDKYSKSQAFKIYPNPSQGTLTIDYPKMEARASWQVVNMVGQIVEAGKLEHDLQSIHLEHLATGLYVIYLEVNGNLIGSELLSIVK